MIRKLLMILCSAIFVHAGVIGTDFSPSTLVSYSTFSLSPSFVKTIGTPIVEKTAQEFVYEKPELSPVYESILNTGSKYYHTAEDGSVHKTLSKSFNTDEFKINKLDTITTKDAVSHSVPSFSAPIFTEAIYKSGSYSQETASPLVFSTHGSSEYATETRPLAEAALVKSPSAYFVGSSPVVYNTKVTPGLSAYASPSIHYASIKPLSLTNQMKTVTYSETPIVSTVSVSGSGANYSW